MFKNSLLIALTGLICASGWICISIFWIDKEDRIDYQKLVESQATQKEDQLSYSQQQRKEICKEVWYQQESQKLHYRILSNQSTLFLFHEKNQLEVVEQMDQVNCFMQEELYYLLPDGREAIAKDGAIAVKKNHLEEKEIFIDEDYPGLIPMQVIRYLEAEKACYNYNTHLFIADHVKLFRYRLKGHELVTSVKQLQPFMSGNAKTIEFTFAEKQCNFTAHQFKATFETIAGGEL